MSLAGIRSGMLVFARLCGEAWYIIAGEPKKRSTAVEKQSTAEAALIAAVDRFSAAVARSFAPLACRWHCSSLFLHVRVVF